jgi:membrane protein required for colicin V production
MLTIADGAVAIMISLSTVISWVRGFIREILSLLAWIGAFAVAFIFAHRLGDLLTGYIKAPSMRTIVASILLFIVTFILISSINFGLSFIVNRVGLSSVDKLCGAFLGVGRGILLVALILLLTKLTPLPQDPWWQNSILIPKFEPIEAWLKSFMPDYIEKHTILAD